MQISLTPIAIRELVRIGRDLELAPKRRDLITFQVRASRHERIELETGEVFSRFAPDDKAIEAELQIVEISAEQALDDSGLHYMAAWAGNDASTPKAARLSFYVNAEKSAFSALRTKLNSGVLPNEIVIHLDAKSAEAEGALTYVGDPLGHMKRWKNAANQSVPVAGATIIFDILTAPEDREVGDLLPDRNALPTSVESMLAALTRIEGILKPIRLAGLLIAGALIVVAVRLWK